MSTRSDVTGTDEDFGKGRAPKEMISCRFFLGHRMNNHMTVVERRCAITGCEYNRA